MTIRELYGRQLMADKTQKENSTTFYVILLATHPPPPKKEAVRGQSGGGGGKKINVFFSRGDFSWKSRGTLPQNGYKPFLDLN